MKKALKKIAIKLLGQKSYNKLVQKVGFLKNPDELIVISRYFKKRKYRGVILDVGVQYGQSSELFLNLNWQVYGFEPDERNRNAIPRYILSNPKYTLFDIAISDQKGELMFYTSTESTGISSLLNFHSSHQKDKIVKVDTLQNVINEFGIKGIRVLKIDTEGFDLNVLKGIDLKKQPDLEVILCEFEDGKTTQMGYTVIDMIEYLQSNNYGVIVSQWHPIVQYGVKHSFDKAQKYPCDINNDAWGNLIAYKDEEFASYFIDKINRLR